MPESQTTDHLLSNKLYDRLKLFALVFLPAAGALYFGLAGIWGLPKAEEVVGTVTVLGTFLGVLIKVGDASYNSSSSKFDGEIRDSTLRIDGSAIDNKDELLLKIDREHAG